MIENAANQGAYFLVELRRLRTNPVTTIRGHGLMIAIDFAPAAGGARRYSKALKDAGVLCKETHTHTLLFAPSLVLTIDQVDWALEQIDRVLRRA